MPRHYTIILHGDIRDDQYEGEFNMFLITLKISLNENGSHVTIATKPTDQHSIAVHLDLRLKFGTENIELFHEILSREEEIYEHLFESVEGKLTLEGNIIEFLPVTTITRETAYRDFQILCASDSYYVNPFQMSEIGGTIFSDWKEKYENDVRRVVVQMDGADLQMLLEAALRHDSITIYRRNYRRLMGIAETYKIHSVMRAIETFLMNSEQHPIRLLEYAVELRMARLFDYAKRQLGAPHQIIDKLNEYLRQNGETMHDIHPKLLQSLNITHDYICIS
ncbi:unnamed protein product [Auanema sp. JU1783]|nr:unnamed protein product [Auanema sp. JU1783]